MKRTVRIFFILASIAVVLMLGGCYSSSYNAVGFVHSNTPHEGYMDFYRFEGRMVMKLKADAGKLHCSGRLESGDITVSCDNEGEKKKLFTLSSGEQLERAFDFPAGSSVYILVETEGRCENGDLSFTADE